MECQVDGCFKPVKMGGKYRGKLCAMHYERQRRGKPMDAPAQAHNRGTLRERFERSYRKNATTGCWLWTGQRNDEGYGRIAVKGQKMQLAHRIAWMLYKGPIPRESRHRNGLAHILHHCDNPRCVNPDHLYAGDDQANTHDKIARGRYRRGQIEGSKVGTAKLTEEQVALIKQSPERGTVLARQFVVSKTVIYLIRNGTRWRHVAVPIDQQHTHLSAWNKGVPRDVWAPKKTQED